MRWARKRISAMAGPHRFGEAVGQAVAVGAAGRRRASRRKRRWSARPVDSDSSRGFGTGSVWTVMGPARSPKTARGQNSRGSGRQDGGATAVSRRQGVLRGGVEGLRGAALALGAALPLRGRPHRRPLLRRAQEPVPGRLVAAVPEE